MGTSWGKAQLQPVHDPKTRCPFPTTIQHHPTCINGLNCSFATPPVVLGSDSPPSAAGGEIGLVAGAASRGRAGRAASPLDEAVNVVGLLLDATRGSWPYY